MISWWLERPDYDPPGPDVVLHLTVMQARDLLEAYKASRYRRPFTTEIVRLLEAAIASATRFP